MLAMLVMYDVMRMSVVVSRAVDRTVGGDVPPHWGGCMTNWAVYRTVELDLVLAVSWSVNWVNRATSRAVFQAVSRTVYAVVEDVVDVAKGRDRDLAGKDETPLHWNNWGEL